MSGRTIYIRVSLIERRWLRRTAIVATFVPMLAVGLAQYVLWVPILWVLIPLGAIDQAVRMTARLCRGAAKVWRYPNGPCQDIANPLCAGGIRELDRKGRLCPKCGSADDGVCLGWSRPACSEARAS